MPGHHNPETPAPPPPGDGVVLHEKRDRIASERAMLGSFEARHGFHHGDGGVVRLANDGGVGVAMHVVGQPLDAQLRTEAWNGYTCADPEETRAMLEPLYEKTDPGRAGEHRTEL